MNALKDAWNKLSLIWSGMAGAQKFSTVGGVWGLWFLLFLYATFGGLPWILLLAALMLTVLTSFALALTLRDEVNNSRRKQQEQDRQLRQLRNDGQVFLNLIGSSLFLVLVAGAVAFALAYLSSLALQAGVLWLSIASTILWLLFFGGVVRIGPVAWLSWKEVLFNELATLTGPVRLSVEVNRVQYSDVSTYTMTIKGKTFDVWKRVYDWLSQGEMSLSTTRRT